MTIKCPHCSMKVNTDWVIFSSANARYRCLDCSSLIGWNERYKRAYPAAVLVVLAGLITVKSVLVDQRWFVEVDFVQNIFVLAGMLVLVLFLKLLMPLQRFIKIIEMGDKT